MKKELDSSFPKIEKVFDKLNSKSFTAFKLRSILSQNVGDWGVPKRKLEHVIDYLVGRKLLFRHDLLDTLNQIKPLYTWKAKDEYTIFSGLKDKAYYTHYTALHLHGLTLQIPKIYYLNGERSSGSKSTPAQNPLTQKSIDEAFKKIQRKSLSAYIYLDKKVILTSGKFTNRLGVAHYKQKGRNYYYTDLERTLIDVAVRPAYSGGVFEVKEAFRKAKGKVDTQRLAEYLMSLDYTYPYEQLIGFYLEKTGYSQKEIKLFDTQKEFNFYMTYNIRNKDYCKKWKLFYPKGLV